MGKSKLQVRSGFTIIEVLLVLGITGFLLSGLMVGVGSAIARQRYRDSVHDFAEFLRRTYSSVLTVQNPRKNFIGSNNYCGLSDKFDPADIKKINEKPEDERGLPGRTNCAYYGKMITFGEENQGDKIFVYDIVGKDYLSLSGTAKNTIVNETAAGATNFAKNPDLALNVLTLVPEGDTLNECSLQPFGLVQTYAPQWQARIEVAKPDVENFKGTLLVIRSLFTGRLHTYYYKETLQVQKNLASRSSAPGSKKCDSAGPDNLNLSTLLSNDSFNEPAQDDRISFCVGSSDTFAAGGIRRNVVINNAAGNTSAIEIIPQDSKDNKCVPPAP